MFVRHKKGLALLALAGLLLGAALPAGGTARVAAESPAIIVGLSYVRGYSTWGPTNVTGVARLWPGEGVVVLNVHDLPRLLNGDMYVAWLVNTASGESLRLDAFNTSDAGSAEMDKIFDQALPRGANALLVTVGHPGDSVVMPGPQRTLVGYFPPQNTAPAPQQPPVPAASATPVPVAPPPPVTPTVTPRATVAPNGGGPAPRAHHGQGRTRAHHPVVVILPQTGGAANVFAPATKVAWQGTTTEVVWPRPSGVAWGNAAAPTGTVVPVLCHATVGCVTPGAGGRS